MPREFPAPSSGASVFAGPGEMRARCRAFDWSSTALGPVDDWSTSLRVMAGAVLSAPHPMFLWWGPELVQLYNDGYCATLGAAGRHPHALGTSGREFWADAWNAIGPRIERVMGAGESVGEDDADELVEGNARRDDVWSTCSWSPVRDDDGSIGGTLGVCAETTQRAPAERQIASVTRTLSVERDRISSIFRRAPAFMAVLRGPEQVIELVNEAAVALTGHRDLVGRPLFDAIPEMSELLRPCVGDDFPNGRSVIVRETPSLLQTYPGAVQEEQHFDFACVDVIEPDGTCSGVIVHGTDVTSHVRARCALEALAQHESAARAVAEAKARACDEALRVLVHDLGNPLAAVDMVATALFQDVGAPALPVRVRRRLAAVLNGVRLMSRLIRDLTEVAIIEVGHFTLEMREVPVGDVLEVAAAMFVTSARVGGVTLLVRVPPDLPVVRADPDRLVQALANLIANALKFSDAGGRITLSAEQDPAGIRLIVQDTGPGIVADDLPHVFDRYWQKRQAGGKPGTGLGLAIVRGIVEAHGGTINVASTPGAGSAFSFTIPSR